MCVGMWRRCSLLSLGLGRGGVELRLESIEFSVQFIVEDVHFPLQVLIDYIHYGVPAIGP